MGQSLLLTINDFLYRFPLVFVSSSWFKINGMSSNEELEKFEKSVASKEHIM
jgi:hypothetical protein